MRGVVEVLPLGPSSQAPNQKQIKVWTEVRVTPHSLGKA